MHNQPSYPVRFLAMSILGHTEVALQMPKHRLAMSQMQSLCLHLLMSRLWHRWTARCCTWFRCSSDRCPPELICMSEVDRNLRDDAVPVQ